MKQKSIGIISMQRVVNYGSFLQAYAFSKILSNYTHDIEFVDYKVSRPKIKNFKDFILYLLNISKKLIFEILMKAKFVWRLLPNQYVTILENNRYYRQHILPIIGVTKKKKYDSNKDIIFIGSDEVFNCLQSNINVGYSTNLFGENLKSKVICSYAASFGNTTYDRLIEHGVKDEIGCLLNNFRYISVRDQNSFEIVKKIINKEPFIHLDPVLLYDFNNEIGSNKENQKYMIIYAYRNRLNEVEQKSIVEYAEANEYKIISLGGYQSFSDKHVSCNPFEMLTYIKYSECVVTDTFHGAIYSIIFGKRFASYVRKSSSYGYGNEEKITFLLQTFNLQSHIINESLSVKSILEKEVDYMFINNIIKQERSRTFNYLSAVINGNEVI